MSFVYGGCDLNEMSEAEARVSERIMGRVSDKFIANRMIAVRTMISENRYITYSDAENMYDDKFQKEYGVRPVNIDGEWFFVKKGLTAVEEAYYSIRVRAASG